MPPQRATFASLHKQFGRRLDRRGGENLCGSFGTSKEARSELVDVVLGVAVTGQVARLALIGASASGNRVVATRLCLPDPSEAETLRMAVSNAGVQNVEVVTETEAAAALAR